ncbi:MAG: hypothetical protein PHI53_00440 [Candidatus Pacebacteria bacterium]|nr:hypothetical protein [Candidatus Paceibacterota bacterium]
MMNKQVIELIIKLLENLSGEEHKKWELGLRRMILGLNPWEDLRIKTRPFDPDKFLWISWRIVPEEQDQKSASLQEVDFSKVDFAGRLKEKENLISCRLMLNLLRKSNRILYGASVFMGLWMDYELTKEDSVLEFIYREKGIESFCFLGDVIEDPSGEQRILSLRRNKINGEWLWQYFKLDEPHSIAVVSKEESS